MELSSRKFHGDIRSTRLDLDGLICIHQLLIVDEFTIFFGNMSIFNQTDDISALISELRL